MTYKESYEEFTDCKSLMEKVIRDIKIALIFNPDRIKCIKIACDEVVNDKFPTFKSYSNGVLKNFDN